MFLVIALLIFALLVNWLFTGLLSSLPIHLLFGMDHLLGYVVLGGSILLVSWLFGE